MNTANPIHSATGSLLEEISGSADFYLVSAYKTAVLYYGSKADADEVLKHFLIDPAGLFASDLLEIVAKWGDERHAAQLFSHSISDGRLKEDFPEEVLETLGQMKYESIKPVLAHYAFNTTDYYPNMSAVLGLLHFDCQEYREQIKSSIEGILDQNLFPEYLPALICKLQDRKDLLAQLYQSGSTTISTDCNAGIFLAFALCGEEGKDYFKKALFDPNWEAFYNSAHTVVKGMDHLKISFDELLQEATLIEEEKELQYYMLVLISLLEIRVKSYKSFEESFEKIYRSLFVTKIFPILAEKAGQQDDVDKLEELLVLRMKGEVLMRYKK